MLARVAIFAALVAVLGGLAAFIPVSPASGQDDSPAPDDAESSGAEANAPADSDDPPAPAPPAHPQAEALQSLYTSIRAALLDADGEAFWAVLARSSQDRYRQALDSRKELIADFPAEEADRIDPNLGITEAELMGLEPPQVISAQLKRLPASVRRRLERCPSIEVIRVSATSDFAEFVVVDDVRESHYARLEGGRWKYRP